MFENNDRIDAREAFFFILAAMIEVGTLTDARFLAKEVGADAWLAFPVGYLFALPGIIIMSKLSQRFYKHGFVQYTRFITGPVIGWMLSAALVVYWILACARVLRYFSEITKLTLLDRTPTEVIAFSFLAVTVYIARYGIEPLSRASILLCISVLPAIMIIFATTIPKVKFDNFLPFMTKGPLPLLEVGLKEIGDWEEMSFLLILAPFVYKPKSMTKVAVYSATGVLIFVTYIIFLTIGVIGQEESKVVFMPTISALSGVEFPGTFIERLSSLFVGLWIMIAFPTIASLLWATALVLSQMFGLTEYKPFVMPLVPIIYMISLIPQNTVEIQSIRVFLTLYGIAVLLVIPLVLYIIAVIRKLRDT